MPVRLLVSESVDVVQAAAEAAGVPLLVGPEPPAIEIFCDTRQLRSALVNLLDNAIKYTPAGSPLDIIATATEQNLTIEVADRGPGLPPGREDKVFEKFYQTEPGEGRGAGLGLAICQGIVRAHGGRIWAQNLPGRGVAFLFTLPLVAPSPAPGHA
jgi:two-component system sensor histidine kinase KdpD